MKKKIFYGLEKVIIAIFIIVFLAIAGMVCLLAKSSDYACKAEFLLPNIVLLLIGIAVVGCISMFLMKYYQKIEPFLKKVLKPWICILFCAGMIVFQLFTAYHTYFLGYWDTGTIMNESYAIATGDLQNLNNAYFSYYPNNILLIGIFSTVIKLFGLFMELTFSRALFSIIILQSFLSGITSFLLFQVVKKMTSSYTAAASGWVVYVLLVGTSPWVMMPYSDSMCLIIPLAIFYLYQLQEEKEKQWLYWGFIGLLSSIGYKIKPQAVFILFAIIIMETIKILTYERLKTALKSFGMKIGMIVAGIAIVSLLTVGLADRLGYQLNKEDNYGMAHFFMMGLNADVKGVWSIEDVAYTKSFATKEERTAGNLAMAKQRIADLGPSGLLELYKDKTLTNYGDGSFAWNKEGSFYAGIFPEKNPRISHALKQILWEGGKYHELFLTSKQLVWLSMILFMSGLAIRIRKRSDLQNQLLVLMMALIGITLFQMMFEARARYLYAYAPIYIILAVMGVLEIMKAVLRRRRCK